MSVIVLRLRLCVCDCYCGLPLNCFYFIIIILVPPSSHLYVCSFLLLPNHHRLTDIELSLNHHLPNVSVPVNNPVLFAVFRDRDRPILLLLLYCACQKKIIYFVCPKSNQKTKPFICVCGKNIMKNITKHQKQYKKGIGSPQQTIKLPPISADDVKINNDAVDNGIKITRKFFTNKTKAIVWGMQQRAVQSMLDFDFICR